MDEAENPSPSGRSNGEEGPLFPSARAFVVQLTRDVDVDVDAKSCLGRVEHVTSGRSTRFHSREELVAFMHGVLGELVSRSMLGHPGDVDGPGSEAQETQAGTLRSRGRRPEEVG